MAQVKGFHHVSLSVRDASKSAEWYQEVLDLDVETAFDGEAFRRVRLRARDSGATLTLTSHERQSSEPFDERRTGLDHLAFQVDGDDIVALKRRLEGLGVDHSPIKKSSGGSAMITLRDPDNIQLEVFGGHFDPDIAAGGAGS